MRPSDLPPERRVVVTGWGMVSPLGGSVEATWAACAEGRSGVREIARWDTRGLPYRIGGEVDDAWITATDPDPHQATRPHRLLVTAAREASAQARLDEVKDRRRVAVVAGGHAGSPAVADIERTVRHIGSDGVVDTAALTRERDYAWDMVHWRRCDRAPAVAAGDLKARGLVMAIVSACAASAQAIGEATRWLREGRADAVVAGGVEAHLTYAGVMGFTLLGALAKRYPSPEKASRPFDRRRTGFVMSEGAGAVVLETLASAQARGATPLGEVLGYGDSADGFRITDVHPEGAGAVLAMQRAMADAGVSPADVEYVNAHGTSTPTNDPSETLAIKRALGEERARAVPVSSNKSMLGHTIGAAG
ncbi:MAG TPA: beta-ketoacyl-[acyl-carrier-protein] synthase family protein, partial [Planctomycetota bacterium]|nr:beta-ketoacyl-[acyl-carrier-protein] synthase family protein [Planctomycetota bacterium]